VWLSDLGAGTLRDRSIKKSLDLRNWEAAQKLGRDWQSGDGGSENISARKACESFVKDCDLYIEGQFTPISKPFKLACLA
jgi:hypothetical protein